MTVSDIDYQAILDRIVAIMKADTTNIYGPTLIRNIVTGAYTKGKYPPPCAFVTFQNGNDTFYDTASLTSNHELYILITVMDSQKDSATLESALLSYIRYIKEAIKNNVKLGTPGNITSDTKVDRAWPIKFMKAVSYDQQNNAVGGVWVTIRATKLL